MFPAYPHEVLAVVLTVREGRLQVLLWQRAQAPYAGRWALPGGGVREDQRLKEALAEHLAAKVHVDDLAWREQVATHSKVDRDPRARVLATGYLGLVPSDVDPTLPDDTAWHLVDALPPLAFDHGDFVSAAVDRLRAKLSYTNIAFALAPHDFTIATLRGVVTAALGYDVTATNLTRVMTRRQMIEPTGRTRSHSSAGGRPATEYRFCDRTLTVTDPFAVLRPPRGGHDEQQR
ncbi:NUDIX hydrolase [Nocardioides aequoreus]|uniref:NUDIX hydrolase n=1 Tax=Nocardioides aequoreus TaxID=397278 RepID=UPI0004C3E859|nr:NUDIX domain-containing protein [Nocardioides aequoreus]